MIVTTTNEVPGKKVYKDNYLKQKVQDKLW